MRVALIQLDVVWEDKGANLAGAGALIAGAAAEGADIAVLPEMFNTGFSMNAGAVSEEATGRTASFLSETAKKHSINIIAGLSVRGSGEMGRNAAHAYDREGRLKASYTKMHPFCYAGEDKHYEAGHETVVFELEGVPASVFICYDLRFPEVFRKVAGDVLAVFVIANWPAQRAEHWELMLRARAVENQCFMVGVNRTGKDANRLRYAGGSLVAGPTGEVLCRGSAEEELVLCDFDPRDAERVRKKFPFLNDMRHL